MLYVGGNIFDSPMQVLTNPVNTVGVMGAGLAKQFRDRYPDVYLRYRTACLTGKFLIGQPRLWGRVLCFPTKQHWRNPSRIEWIESGLAYFVANYAELGIQSIAFPLLGCGLGGLERGEVTRLMERYLSRIDIPVEIYAGSK